MDYATGAVVIGVAATAVMDVWTMVRTRAFGIAPFDYALLGRWLAGMPRGRFRRDSIKAAPCVRGERLLGWTAHYVIGIAFAGLLLALWGMDWARHPTLVPALMVGMGSVAAPFLLMQPGMGLGIAASRTPRPWSARLQSLITHAVFGLGLYAAGWAARLANVLAIN